MEERNLICDLCSKPASSWDGDGTSHDEQHCSHKFIQVLSNFLEIRSKFGEKGEDIGRKLVTCDDCFKLGESFRDLYSQWEVLRRQLEGRVKEVFDVIKDAGQISPESEEKTVNGGDSYEVPSEIKSLGEELLKGCKNKLNYALPRNVLQKIQNEKNEDMVDGISTKCEVSSTSFSDCDKRDWMTRLMSFVAVFQLSIPFNPQESYKIHVQQQETRYSAVDKQVQTSATSDEKQGNENGTIPVENPNKRKRSSTPQDVDFENNLGQFKRPKAKTFNTEIWLNDHIQADPAHHSSLAESNDEMYDKKQIGEVSSPVNDCSNDLEMANDEDVGIAPETISAPATPSSCYICQSPFDSPVLLTSHLQSVHKIQVSFECPLCGIKRQEEKQFRLHMRVIHNTASGLPGSFQCEECKELFPSDRGLKTHRGRVHNVHQPCFKCDKCPRYFGTRTKLHAHSYGEHMHVLNQNQQRTRMTRHHQEEPTPASPSSFVVPASISSVLPPNVASDEKQKENENGTISVDNLKEKMGPSTPKDVCDEQEIGEESSPVNDCRNDLEMANDEDVATATRKSTPSSSSFILPATTCSIPFKNLNCPICKSTSESQEALVSHVRLIHKLILAYQCVCCETKLNSVEGFRFHMNFIHGKVFKTDEELLKPTNLTLGYIVCQGDEENYQNQDNMSWPSITGIESETNSQPFAADENYEERAVLVGPSTLKATIIPTKNKPGQSKSEQEAFTGRKSVGNKIKRQEAEFTEENQQQKERMQPPPVITLESSDREDDEVERDPQPLPSWECVICQAFFNSGVQFTTHMKEEHNQVPLVVKFVCTPCGQEFETSEDFENHMFRAHQEILQKESAADGENNGQASSSYADSQVPLEGVGWKYVCPEVGFMECTRDD